MLGNFSFGDYFREEAIHMAWRFVTKELGLPAERLMATVHHTDDKSAEYWKAMGVSEVQRLGDDDNLWSIGDGPGH